VNPVEMQVMYRTKSNFKSDIVKHFKTNYKV